MADQLKRLPGSRVAVMVLTGLSSRVAAPAQGPLWSHACETSSVASPGHGRLFTLEGWTTH